MNFRIDFGVGLCAVLALAACDAGPDRTGIVVLPGMFDSVPYDAYDRHPLGGQTLRAPPEGTVPYGAERLDFGPGEAEAIRAGRELTNPLEPTIANIQRGAKLYTTFCQICHGASGEGDGPIIGRFPNPPSLSASHARSMPEGRVFHVISHGQGIMAPYRYQISAADRWRIILHLGTGILADAADRGRVAWRKAGCATCHGTHGHGGVPNPNTLTGKVPSLERYAEKVVNDAKSLSKLQSLIEESYRASQPIVTDDAPWLDRFVRTRARILYGAVPEKVNAALPDPPKQMPAFNGKLTDREINDVIAYVVGFFPADGWTATSTVTTRTSSVGALR